MLNSRLKRALVDGLARGARAVGERSLALLITAGVASCGGQTNPPADASTDAPPDSPVITEAPYYDGALPEAPAYDGGPSDSGTVIEAPNFDAGG
jgi:hypothetical protein